MEVEGGQAGRWRWVRRWVSGDDEKVFRRFGGLVLVPFFAGLLLGVSPGWRIFGGDGKRWAQPKLGSGAAEAAVQMFLHTALPGPGFTSLA